MSFPVNIFCLPWNTKVLLGICLLMFQIGNWSDQHNLKRLECIFLEERRTGVPENLNKGENSNLQYFVGKEKGSKLMTDWSHMQLNVWLHT